MCDPISFQHSEVFIREFAPLQLSARISPDPTRNYRAGLLDNEFHAYAAALLDYPGGHFNIIVVDGMARVLTAWLASRQLAEDGMIVFAPMLIALMMVSRNYNLAGIKGFLKS